jgi:hypothetical protein
MSALGDKIAIRTSSLFLSVLLVLTPVTQVLAQAEQQGQESQASQTESKENSEPGAVPQDEEWETALPVARVAEADTVQLLRLEATVFFPKTDSPPLYGSASETPTAAARSIGANIGLVVLSIVILVVILVIVCNAEGGCLESNP